MRGKTRLPATFFARNIQFNYPVEWHELEFFLEKFSSTIWLVGGRNDSSLLFSTVLLFNCLSTPFRSTFEDSHRTVSTNFCNEHPRPRNAFLENRINSNIRDQVSFNQKRNIENDFFPTSSNGIRFSTADYSCKYL